MVELILDQLHLISLGVFIQELAKMLDGLTAKLLLLWLRTGQAHFQLSQVKQGILAGRAPGKLGDNTPKSLPKTSFATLSP